MANPPILVVGAGIGGLAATLRLAAAGYRVTLLDAAQTPGGKMRQLPSAAGPVDAGPTVLTLKDVFEDLFAAAGARLSDHVTLHAEPLLARHFWPDGSRLDLTDDAADNAAAIRAFAGPRAAQEFRRFQADTARLMDAFEAPVMRADAPRAGAAAMAVLRDPRLLVAMAPMQSLAARLARTFSDPRLRQLFGRYTTYVGGTPQRTPALLSLVWQAEARGIWRVEGGIHALAVAIADLANARGAAIRYASPIARIELRDGRPAAAITADGTRHSCAALLFAGDPAALRAGALGDGLRGAVGPRAVAPRSLSADTHAFAAVPSRDDLAHHNVFFAADPATEFGPLGRGAPPVDPSIYVCAQDRGTGRTPPAPERFLTIANAPPEPATGAAPCPPTTFAALRARGLTFDPEPGPGTRTRPADFAALFPHSRGALYGRSPEGAMATFRRPTTRSRIPGLYLAGGGTHPGAGIPMAALSGRHAAEAIMADRTSP